MRTSDRLVGKHGSCLRLFRNGVLAFGPSSHLRWPDATDSTTKANAFQGGSSADSKNLLSVRSVFLVQFSFLSGDIALHAFRDSDRLTFFNLAPPLNRSKIEFLRANLTLLSKYFFPVQSRRELRW